MLSPSIVTSTSASTSTSSLLKSGIIDRGKEIRDMNTQLENDRLMKMIEASMTNKINELNNKIELQEKQRKFENEKRINSSICHIM